MNAIAQITPTEMLVQPWPARTTIKRTFRALERWIEDRKADLSTDELTIARAALFAVGELDQSNAETMTLIVDSARARLLTFTESFAAGSPSIVPSTTTITLATMLETVIEGIDGP